MYEFMYMGIKTTCLPKSEMIVGATYSGRCRNASEAVWLGNCFEYTRYKFGDEFKELINHPEDDNGFDLFIVKKLVKIEQVDENFTDELVENLNNFYK